VDAQGETWRAYRFIENARTYETVTSAEQAFQAARAFGHFQQQLSSLPPPRLHETIPDFHHTPKRFAALEQASPQTLPAARLSPSRRLNLPALANPSPAFCSTPICPSALPTTTPSSTTSCSTTKPAKPSA
jgi:hypothetical protein